MNQREYSNREMRENGGEVNKVEQKLQVKQKRKCGEN